MRLTAKFGLVAGSLALAYGLWTHPPPHRKIPDQKGLTDLLSKLEPTSPQFTSSIAYRRAWEKSPILIQRHLPKPRGYSWDPETVAALNTLHSLGPAAAPAVPQLSRFLTDHRQPLSYRIQVIQALGEIGPAAMIATNVLQECLHNSSLQFTVVEPNPASADLLLRRTVATALAQIGDAHPSTIASIERLIDDAGARQDELARITATVALWALNSSPTQRSRVERLLHSGSDDERSTTMYALARFGHRADGFAEDLRLMTESDSKTLRNAAIFSLGKIDPKWMSTDALLDE